MSTLKEVAQAAGVSTVTASSVLSGANRVRVSDETAKRIRNTALELNYVPRAAARGLRTGKVQAIGFITSPHGPGRWYSHWQESLRGVGDVLWNRNERLILSLSKSESHELEIIRQLAFGHQVDGMVIQDCRQGDPRAKILQEAKTPFIAIGGTIAEGGHLVNFDVTRFTSLLCRHMLFKSDGIAILAPRAKTRNDELFSESCQTACKVAGKPLFEWTGALLPDTDWFARSADEAGGRLGIILARQLLPELIGKLRKANIEMGRDAHVAYLACAGEVPLAPEGLEVVPLDHYTLGRRAAQMLFKNIDNKESNDNPPQTLVLPGIADTWTEAL